MKRYLFVLFISILIISEKSLGALNPNIEISSSIKSLNELITNVVKPMANLKLKNGIFIKGPIKINKIVKMSLTNLNMTNFSLNWNLTKFSKISNNIIQLEIQNISMKLSFHYNGKVLLTTEKGNGSVNLKGIKIILQISFKSSKTGALINAQISKCSFKLKKKNHI